MNNKEIKSLTGLISQAQLSEIVSDIVSNYNGKIEQLTATIKTLSARISEIDETYGAAMAGVGDAVTLLAENQGAVLAAAAKIDHVDDVVDKAVSDMQKATDDFKLEVKNNLAPYADGLAAVNERMEAYEANIAARAADNSSDGSDDGTADNNS